MCLGNTEVKLEPCLLPLGRRNLEHACVLQEGQGTGRGDGSQLGAMEPFAYSFSRTQFGNHFGNNYLANILQSLSHLSFYASSHMAE